MAQGHTLLVFDVPLLVESVRWRSQVDQVWVVDCLVDTQIARVVSRSGLQPDEVRHIIAAQASRAQRLAAADGVIFNEGLSLEQLRQEIAQITFA